ncbi:hypothetical protein RSP673_023270 (plasmid) [Ralstonia solanacearum P673]|uniref:hypothetical protein n=1 Tax=Ralstonia solanacearum TaxID=305 RepID=UPI001F375F7A|nr:hypothetical protein [Ralstonia solanacearum]MCL9848481.1 hypothetical protein [Ralstonia solanacearum]MCL9853806.1 hypothetical protein [Ralstonia solanacearum]MCL9861254.1 hypothetical protein [Ralstonia solanacearum]MCL9862809.1 hypothetical protein [Ralstonia solanacearum]MCL9870185.1 hypothetical protein [Ralstonia solanacearum]
MHRPSRTPPTLQSHASAAARIVAIGLDTANTPAMRLAASLFRAGTMPLQPRRVPVRVRARRW